MTGAAHKRVTGQILEARDIKRGLDEQQTKSSSRRDAGGLKVSYDLCASKAPEQGAVTIVLTVNKSVRKFASILPDDQRYKIVVIIDIKASP